MRKKNVPFPAIRRICAAVAQWLGYRSCWSMISSLVLLILLILGLSALEERASERMAQTPNPPFVSIIDSEAVTDGVDPLKAADCRSALSATRWKTESDGEAQKAGPSVISNWEP